MTLLAAAAPLAPSAPWTVHADVAYCTLSREFQGKRGPVNLMFQPALTSGPMALTVLTPASFADPRTGEAKITREPGADVIKGRYFSNFIPKQKMRFTQTWLGGDLFARLGDTGTLRIQAGPEDVSVPIKFGEKVRTAFRQCEDGLLESWGIRPAAVRGGTGPALKGNVGDFFPDNIYPLRAVNAGYIGYVRAIVIVDPAGRAAECKIVNRIGPAFDKVTCDQVMKMTFVPGLDEKGAPARSLFSLTVRWAMDG